jgi:DNA-binding transcriptional regulator YiaG
VATFAKQWQDEIRRLARKETKDDLLSLKAENVSLKKQLAALKKRLDDIERHGKKLRKTVAKVAPDAVPAEGEDENAGPRIRVTGKTVRTLRAKLGLTQAEFAALLGVTGQSVYQWERRDDRIRLRNATREAFAAIKGIGSREARRRLESMSAQ